MVTLELSVFLKLSIEVEYYHFDQSAVFQTLGNIDLIR